MSEPIIRHLCSTCEHEQVCRWRDIYCQEIENVRKTNVAQITVECEFFKPKGINIREPFGFKEINEKFGSKKSGDFRDRESFPK